MRKKVRNCNIICRTMGIAILLLFIIIVSANKYNIPAAFMIMPCVIVYAYCDAQREKARRIQFERRFGQDTYQMFQAMEDWMERERR